MRRRSTRTRLIPRALLVAWLVGLPGPDSNAQSDADYYPLATGSRWSYSVIITGGLLGLQEGSSVTAVEAEETVNGRRYFRVTTSFTRVGLPNDTLLLRKGADGIYKLEAGVEQLMMPLPLKAGLKWTTRGPAPRREVNRHVVEGPETVDLATDTFSDCFKVVNTSITATSADYFAPNVGLVKTTGAVAGSKLNFSLESYQRRF